MDITPLIPEGRQIIQGYGNGVIQVSGITHATSLIIFPHRTVLWNANTLSEITLDAFQELDAEWDGVSVLLLGTGKTQAFLDPECEEYFRQKRIVVEGMDSGAACRTYNVLLSEERAVAAAIIAI